MLYTTVNGYLNELPHGVGGRIRFLQGKLGIWKDDQGRFSVEDPETAVTHAVRPEVGAAVRKVAARREVAAGKKAEVEGDWQELQDARERCGAACTCEAEWPAVCPVAGMKRCATCKDVKSRMCVKRVCVAALRPLMLMPPTVPLALPAPPNAPDAQQ